MRKNAVGNDTVPISLWRGGGICAVPNDVAVVGYLSRFL